jgi:Cellulase (glycosyl hydrolase family 5)
MQEEFGENQFFHSFVGTADLNAWWRMKSAEFQPSLRDFVLSASIPSLEKAGLGSVVPPGHKAADFRKLASAFLHHLLVVVFLSSLSARAQPAAAKLEFIGLSKDGKHFVRTDSAAVFTPWGFNYDRDVAGQLIEDYWNEDWPAVALHFGEMKALGANVVRIHLQVAKFMNSTNEPNAAALRQLARLVDLAERTGLYLDVTGPGCYKKEDVPPWYNALNESQRWDVQALFWEAVAKTCATSPAIFCYDLMNEPVVTEDKTGRDWTPGAFGDRYYVQRLTFDFAGREPKQIARAWVDEMWSAVRRYDQRHLVTVGAIPWALTFPGAKPLFYSKEVGEHLDFVSVHFYPKHGEVPQALTALSVYNVGKPMVIEEMFPLNCTMADLAQFIEGSKSMACGWIGFYWGKTFEQYKAEKKSADATTLEWLEYFVREAPLKLAPRSAEASSARSAPGH